MVLAIIAFTAGRTVLTPTSHGSSKQSPDYWVIYGEKYLKLTIVIKLTRVMTGNPLKHYNEHVLHDTISFTLSPVMTVQ